MLKLFWSLEQTAAMFYKNCEIVNIWFQKFKASALLLKETNYNYNCKDNNTHLDSQCSKLEQEIQNKPSTCLPRNNFLWENDNQR